MTLHIPRRRGALAAALCVTLLGACGAMPQAGPSAATVAATPGVTIERVTPAAALAMEAADAAADRRAVEDALSALGAGAASDPRFGAGDSVHVQIWTLSPWPGKSGEEAAGGPAAIDLGTFRLDADGVVDLPYAHRIRLAGLTARAAQDLVGHRYAALGILQDPSVMVTPGDAGTDGVTVTGAIGQPKVIAWSPGGMTAARVVTLALGDGNQSFGETARSDGGQAAQTVTILRRGAAPVTLPLSVALERDVWLRPADQLVVKRMASVRVVVAGGGLRHDGVLDFAERPSLAGVVAQAQGLDPNTADANGVFVFRRVPGATSALFEFAGQGGASLLATQAFPMHDGDVVYVAEAPIVPVARLLNTVFQLALPASLAR